MPLCCRSTEYSPCLKGNDLQVSSKYRITVDLMFCFLLAQLLHTLPYMGPRQLTGTNWPRTNWPRTKWRRLAEKGDRKNILLSSEPSCPNPHFMTKSLRRNRWFAVSLSQSVDLSRPRIGCLISEPRWFLAGYHNYHETNLFASLVFRCRVLRLFLRLFGRLFFFYVNHFYAIVFETKIPSLVSKYLQD